MLVVICDEVDQLASQDQEVLYELFALTKVGPQGGMVLLKQLCCLGHDVLCWLVSHTWLFAYWPQDVLCSPCVLLKLSLSWPTLGADCHLLYGDSLGALLGHFRCEMLCLLPIMLSMVVLSSLHGPLAYLAAQQRHDSPTPVSPPLRECLLVVPQMLSRIQQRASLSHLQSLGPPCLLLWASTHRCRPPAPCSCLAPA